MPQLQLNHHIQFLAASYAVCLFLVVTTEILLSPFIALKVNIQLKTDPLYGHNGMERPHLTSALQHIGNNFIVLERRTRCAFQKHKKWKRLSVHMPPAFPHCTVLLPKSPLVVMDWDTHTQTHTHVSDSMTSTADLGGNNSETGPIYAVHILSRPTLNVNLWDPVSNFCIGQFIISFKCLCG